MDLWGSLWGGLGLAGWAVTVLLGAFAGYGTGWATGFWKGRKWESTRAQARWDGRERRGVAPAAVETAEPPAEPPAEPRPSRDAEPSTNALPAMPSTADPGADDADMDASLDPDRFGSHRAP